MQNEPVAITKEALSSLDQRLLACWAADCAEHVLARFEGTYPREAHPRQAIEAARAWVRGDLRMMEARKAAFAAHAAARAAEGVEAACAAARATGHAAATAHMTGHAYHAAAYALKAVDAGDSDRERAWQEQRLAAYLQGALQ